jgi:hypothetical protein
MEGLWVPAGTSGVFGEYVLHLTAGESERLREQIVMRFQSERPIIARADGVVSFQCALRHPHIPIASAVSTTENPRPRPLLSCRSNREGARVTGTTETRLRAFVRVQARS